MEADVIADALEYDTLQVVVEQRPRHAAERLEREHVPAQKALQRLVEREAGEHRAGP